MKKALIDKYLNGETSLAEEQELLHFLRTMPADLLTKEESAIRMMLSYHKNSPHFRTSVSPNDEDIFTSDFTEEYDHIVNRRKRLTWWKYMGIAATVAIVAIVGAVGLRNTMPTDNLVVAYVYGTETTDEEVVMSMMKSTMSEMLSCSTADEQLYELFNPE